MPALALTDHGSMYGVIPFYAAAKQAGIKPIIGIEAYVAPRGMANKEGKADADYHPLLSGLATAWASPIRSLVGDRHRALHCGGQCPVQTYPVHLEDDLPRRGKGERHLL